MIFHHVLEAGTFGGLLYSVGRTAEFCGLETDGECSGLEVGFGFVGGLGRLEVTCGFGGTLGHLEAICGFVGGLE